MQTNALRQRVRENLKSQNNICSAREVLLDTYVMFWLIALFIFSLSMFLFNTLLSLPHNRFQQVRFIKFQLVKININYSKIFVINILHSNTNWLFSLKYFFAVKFLLLCLNMKYIIFLKKRNKCLLSLRHCVFSFLVMFLDCNTTNTFTYS
jgi:hypothetical protein